MRRLVLLLSSCPLAAAAAACGAFGADSQDTTTAAEAGAADGAPTDAPSGGPIQPDGGSPDAPVVTDAAPASPCVDGGGGHWLCDDFDKGSLGLSWQKGLSGDGGVSVVQELSAPSPPNVLASSVSGIDVGRLYAQHYGSEGRLRCELDLRVVTRGSTTASLFVVDLANSAAGSSFYYRVELRASPDTVLVYGGASGTTAYGPTGNFTFKMGWQHFVVDVRVGATQDVTVLLDGTTVSAGGLDAGPLPFPAAHNVSLGLQGLGGNDWTVEYDNVFCDVIP